VLGVRQKRSIKNLEKTIIKNDKSVIEGIYLVSDCKVFRIVKMEK